MNFTLSCSLTVNILLCHVNGDELAMPPDSHCAFLTVPFSHADPEYMPYTPHETPKWSSAVLLQVDNLAREDTEHKALFDKRRSHQNLGALAEPTLRVVAEKGGAAGEALKPQRLGGDVIRFERVALDSPDGTPLVRGGGGWVQKRGRWGCAEDREGGGAAEGGYEGLTRWDTTGERGGGGGRVQRGTRREGGAERQRLQQQSRRLQGSSRRYCKSS